MIRITVDLVPFDDESKSQKIASMLIANDGTGDSEWENYVYAYNDKSSNRIQIGKVENHYHPMGTWSLIRRVINSTDSFYNNESPEIFELLVKRLNADI